MPVEFKENSIKDWILNNLEETCALETLDMSGNLIG